MSFETPVQAVPISVYSIKATFVTERETDGSAIADTYILKIRRTGTSTWTNYQFGPAALYCFIDGLEAYTQYDAQWELTKAGSTSTTSTVYSFYTRYTERFELRPPIPTPLYGEDFPNALQAELDAHVDYINTLDDERSIERFLKEGVGRITGCGLLLSSPQNLSMEDGWFQSGPGLPREDPRWFPGARLFQIATETGAKDIITEDSQILETDGVYYGYAGAYEDTDGAPVIDIEWISHPDTDPLTAPPSPTNGRWIIGKITIVSGLITAVNDNAPPAMQVPSLLSLQALISSLSLGGGGGGGSGEGGPADADKLKFNPADIGIPPESTFAAVNRKVKEVKDWAEIKFQELQPGQETSMEFFISQFARSCASWGQSNPAGLLRIDAAIILPEQYGQEDITLELNGETIPSPTFEGEGNLSYSPSLKLWEV